MLYLSNQNAHTSLKFSHLRSAVTSAFFFISAARPKNLWLHTTFNCDRIFLKLCSVFVFYTVFYTYRMENITKTLVKLIGKTSVVTKLQLKAKALVRPISNLNFWPLLWAEARQQ